MRPPVHPAEISNEGHAVKNPSDHSSASSCASHCRRQHLRTFAHICGQRKQWSRQPFISIFMRQPLPKATFAYICAYLRSKKTVVAPAIADFGNSNSSKFFQICVQKYQWSRQPFISIFMRQPLPKATFAYICAYLRSKKTVVAPTIADFGNSNSSKFFQICVQKYQWSRRPFISIFIHQPLPKATFAYICAYLRSKKTVVAPAIADFDNSNSSKFFQICVQRNLWSRQPVVFGPYQSIPVISIGRLFTNKDVLRGNGT